MTRRKHALPQKPSRAGPVALALAIYAALLLVLSLRETSAPDDPFFGDDDEEIHAMTVTLGRLPSTAVSEAEASPRNPLLNVETAALANAPNPLKAPSALRPLSDVFGTGAPDSTPAPAKPASALWAAIEPCWVQQSGRVPGVRLKVSFSPLGNVAKPPVFLPASTGKPSAAEQLAARQAVTALNHCAPYLAAYGQQDVVIDFPGR